MNEYADRSPKEIRKLIRQEIITGQTSGMAAGYVQANLICLPGDYAEEFYEFAKRNPKPCPVLEVAKGKAVSEFLGGGDDILSSIPAYNIYKNGILTESVKNANDYWTEDMWAFLIGCSFSFEEALMKAGLDVRHISQGRNVPMYRTNIECEPYGRFHGHYVVSMRPYTPEDAEKAAQITEQMPRVHGGPVQIGSPDMIGITDVNKPDYGEAVDIHPGEIPVFWGCGVTPQLVVEEVKPPIAISHCPGHMFIGDILNTDIEKRLREKESGC